MARVTGSLSAPGDTVEIDVSLASQVTAYLTGASYTMSVAFQGSADGTTWHPLAFTFGAAPSPSGVVSASLDNTLTPRSYHLQWPGVVKVRVRATAVTSGTMDVVLETYTAKLTAPSSADGGTDMVDAVQIQGETQQSFAISTTGAQAAAGVSTAGVYDFSCDVDCYLKIAPSAGTASDVTTSTGEPLYGGNAVPHRLAANDRPGAITATGSGTLRYIRVHS